MTVSQEQATRAEMTVQDVVAEALRRIRVVRDAAPAALAVELDDLLEDLDPDAGYSDLYGQDWAMPHLLAALMGVTVREP